MHFMGEKKFWFVICSYLKDSAFTAVKRNARYVKDVLYLLLLFFFIFLRFIQLSNNLTLCYPQLAELF